MPASLSERYGGITTLVAGALFLRVIKPTLYSELRNGTLDFEEIQKILGLLVPADVVRGDIEHTASLDWIVWKRAMSGLSPEALEIPEDFKNYARHAFGMGTPARWGNVEHHFASAFDTYTLP